MSFALNSRMTTRAALPFAATLLALLSSACAAVDDADAEGPEALAREEQALACDPNAPTRSCAAGQVCPPGPPACGPGSEAYAHGGVTVQRVSYNWWGDYYELYEPASPRPAAAPVVFYLHGWAGVDSASYAPLLRHLARRGYVVVFIRYGNAWAPGAYEGNARTAINAAMAELSGPNVHVRPELDPGTQKPRVAFAGHSLGGMLALRLAATVSAAPQLPQPQVLALHDPSTDIWTAPTTTALLPQIPASTRLITILRSESLDANAFSVPAFTLTSAIPRAQKNLISPVSDGFGNPDLVSDHLAVSIPPPDAMDFWGYWRPSEGALNAAFGRVSDNEGYDPFCSAAGSGCDATRNMGTWLSSTQAVAPARNAADLGL